MLNIIYFKCSTIKHLLANLLSKLITFAANNCGYVYLSLKPLWLVSTIPSKKLSWGKQREIGTNPWTKRKKSVLWMEWMSGMWLNDMNVINGPWAFIYKQYHFHAHGNQQLERIAFLEIYAQIVQWTDVHLVPVLENLHVKNPHSNAMSMLPSFMLLLEEMQ